MDEERLNSYFEQVSDPVTYDEVHEMRSKASMTGLSLTQRVGKSGRPHTVNEKISTFVEFLEQEEIITTHRPITSLPKYSPTSDKFFRLERMTAKRGRIPSPKNNDSVDALWVWVSEYSETAPTQVPESFSEPIASNISSEESPLGPLILVEEATRPTDTSDRFSGVSTIRAILESRRTVSDTYEDMDDLRDSAGQYYDNYDNLDDINSLEEFERKHEDRALCGLKDTNLDISFEDKRLQEMDDESALGVLSEVGAEFGRKREIVAVYTLELVFNDIKNDLAVTSFGYPLVIWNS